MSRRATFTLAAIALLASAGTARAQRASLAVGVAAPVGSFANTASNGLDVALQVRTEPMIGPLALRIELGYDFFQGKDETARTTIAAQGISVLGDIGSMFYWAAGPGYYESTVKTQILGHEVSEYNSFFGAQAALGMNFPVFGLDGFVEVGAMKLFSPNPAISYVPFRFGMRL